MRLNSACAGTSVCGAILQNDALTLQGLDLDLHRLGELHVE